MNVDRRTGTFTTEDTEDRGEEKTDSISHPFRYKLNSSSVPSASSVVRTKRRIQQSLDINRQSHQ